MGDSGIADTSEVLIYLVQGGEDQLVKEWGGQI